MRLFNFFNRERTFIHLQYNEFKWLIRVFEKIIDGTDQDDKDNNNIYLYPEDESLRVDWYPEEEYFRIKSV